jgi:hypothetical protein
VIAHNGVCKTRKKNWNKKIFALERDDYLAEIFHIYNLAIQNLLATDIRIYVQIDTLVTIASKIFFYYF